MTNKARFIVFALALIAVWLLRDGGFVAPNPLYAQVIGIVSPGDVMGNGTTSPRSPTDTPITAILDQGACNVASNTIVRLGGKWKCGGVPLIASNNLSDVTSPAAARANLGISSFAAQAGFVIIYYSQSLSKWVYQQPNGTLITTTSSTCQVQEAANYAAANGYGFIFYGQGTANPCNVASNTTITIPAAYYLSQYFFGADFVFNNTNQHGFYLDTQRYGRFFYSGIMHYTGTAGIFAIRPTLGPGGISCTSNSTACWMIDERIDLDTMFADTNGVAACIYYDVGAANGASQLLSSTIGNNIITFNACEGQNNATYGVEVVTPTNTFQAGGENQITFGIIEGTSTSNLIIGTSTSSSDANLGTNVYTGAISITGSSASERGVDSDSAWDNFYLSTLSCFQSVGSQDNVRWETNADNETIHTAQMLKCGGGFVVDNSSLKNNTIVPTIACPEQVTDITSGSSAYTVPLCPTTNGVPPLYIEDELVGGGAGGAGSGTTPGAAGGGNNTTFATATAGGGGAGGAANGANGSGGTGTGCTQTQAGGVGGATVGLASAYGSPGGQSRYGGAGAPGYPNATTAQAGAGQPAAANSGSGGGGAGDNATVGSGGGGGSGAWCLLLLAQPSFITSTTISQSVGTGGAGGAAGVNSGAAAGGNGAAGRNTVKARWQ